MNDVFFTEEENAFRKELREFIDAEIAPHARDIEENNRYPRDLIKKMGDAGYLAVFHPPEYGGSGKGLSTEIIVCEELSAVSPAMDMGRMASVTLFGAPMRRFATEEQKQTYLAPVIRGEKIGAIGITEPDVGSDTAGMKTRAVKEGDEYVINGQKKFITNGSQADYICLFAITNPDVHPKDGMSAFLFPTDTTGFSVVEDHWMLGMAGARVSQLKFENCRIPAENLIGEENRGFRVLMDELDSERTAIAAEAVGYCRVPFEESVKWSTERIQFDRPIKYFEGVSFKIAEMATVIEAARLLTLKAARMYDRGMKITKEAAMAKIFATEASFEVAHKALQVLGGNGYTKNYRTEQFLRDSRLMMIGGGTAEILRFLIQREIYKERGL
ncbi:MAG: acyl-CoA dehydrogenase family protein [Theionarchaea archaeon]|nr:acyl-CoA dehydrogenase family protein [Theionarchaea archaeon]MBU7038093.1 acyl-CoA dehydrogenase family protein [Theionarchaea archaeon]